MPARIKIDKDKLLKDYRKIPNCIYLAKKYNVAGNTMRYWLKSLGVDMSREGSQKILAELSDEELTEAFEKLGRNEAKMAKTFCTPFKDFEHRIICTPKKQKARAKATIAAECFAPDKKLYFNSNRDEMDKFLELEVGKQVLTQAGPAIVKEIYKHHVLIYGKYPKCITKAEIMQCMVKKKNGTYRPQREEYDCKL